MEVQIRNLKGEVVDTAEVSDGVFAVPMNQSLVHQALVMYQQNRRQGTHQTKTRAYVSGGGRKPWPQKYTGRSRQGSIRSPQWRHGGVAFGPHPRDYRKQMPKKMRRMALKCVLSEKVRGGRLIILDDLSLDAPRSKAMKEILGNLGVGASALVVTEEPQVNVVRSARNLPRIWTLPVALLNAEQVLKQEKLVITLDALRKAEELLASEGRDIRATEDGGDEAE
jgi:large subunit ribosomal protein L4